MCARVVLLYVIAVLQSLRICQHHFAIFHIKNVISHVHGKYHAHKFIKFVSISVLKLIEINKLHGIVAYCTFYSHPKNSILYAFDIGICSKALSHWIWQTVWHDINGKASKIYLQFAIVLYSWTRQLNIAQRYSSDQQSFIWNVASFWTVRKYHFVV